MVPYHDKFVHIKDHDHTLASFFVDKQVCIWWALSKPVSQKVGINSLVPCTWGLFQLVKCLLHSSYFWCISSSRSMAVKSSKLRGGFLFCVFNAITRLLYLGERIHMHLRIRSSLVMEMPIKVIWSCKFFTLVMIFLCFQIPIVARLQVNSLDSWCVYILPFRMRFWM